MKSPFRGTLVAREKLSEALTQLTRQKLKRSSMEEFPYSLLPERGGFVGAWGETNSDPFAQVLVVRDEDFSETLTWLNSYFSGLSPITQWCRVLPLSVAERISRRNSIVTLGTNLGLWVGAIVAECSVQAGGIQNLKDIPGSAALSTATFAAGRSAAIWGEDTEYRDIALRHDELSAAIAGDSLRPISAQKLLPLWKVISGNPQTFNPAERKMLMPLFSIISHMTVMAADAEPTEMVQLIAVQAREYFDLNELTECANGPQISRVRALDRLGERLSQGPASPMMDALLGLGASFIDPGMAIAPELLRRYAKQFPIAPIWQGVFAGAISPFRVMIDQNGLGRLISKSLLASDEFEGRPTCDIAFEELIRWVTPGRSLKLDIRGNSARSINVELVPGVTCSFSTASRTTVTKNDSTYVSEKSRSSAHQSDLELSLRNLNQRLVKIESVLFSSQQNLDFSERKTETLNKRPPRGSSSKKP